MSQIPQNVTADQSDVVIPRGISKRALSIAMAIDRLPQGGVYDVEIKKPFMPSEEWQVVIVRSEKLQTMNLTYRPE